MLNRSQKARIRPAVIVQEVMDAWLCLPHTLVPSGDICCPFCLVSVYKAPKEYQGRIPLPMSRGCCDTVMGFSWVGGLLCSRDSRTEGVGKPG
jgi:hypothetical protein